MGNPHIHKPRTNVAALILPAVHLTEAITTYLFVFMLFSCNGRRAHFEASLLICYTTHSVIKDMSQITGLFIKEGLVL
ncbi:hypothetical protein K1T71_013970 [Dendrolimus kikuchii]|uniref:Uncharacterized protein n=1 Tax=Dendrolimus kikuchii TaxID=765133 RepID=A0ACC1CGA8_9NEOP|nr:hypothetical protein K1T71_013970 [Dendrolimus kikuchii]